MATASVVFLCCNTDDGNSQMVCYASSADAKTGQAPAAVSNLTAPGSGSDVIWTGQPLVAFADHPYSGPLPLLPIQTQIEGNAEAQPFQTQVGLGYEGAFFELGGPYRVYNIYRDDGRIVYNDAVLGNVRSLYYCTDSGNRVNAIPPFVPIP